MTEQIPTYENQENKLLFDNMVTCMTNGLENNIPKILAERFLTDNVLTDTSTLFNNFTEFIHDTNVATAMSQTEYFLKTREAKPLNTNVSELAVLKNILTENVYKKICDEAYEMGKPLITDAEYDLLFGNNATGMMVPTGQTVTLPVWLGSLNKVKTEKALELWLKKINKAKYVVITPKLDGVSALMSINHMYSRGSGSVGSSLDRFKQHVIHYYNSPLNIKPNDYIRGELVMKKNTFVSKYADLFKNARNLVAGQTSKTNIDTGILKDVNFIPYEWINSERVNTYPSQQLQYMHGNPNVVNNSGFIWSQVPVKEISFSYLSKLLNIWALYIPYDIDGLVLVPDSQYYSNESGNPELNIAFKKDVNEEEIQVSKVTKVVWQISKWGAYKPVVHIEPVSLEGVIISRVTGHNAKTILEKQIGVNAVVKIIRSGKVIPHIVDVLAPSSNVLLPEGEWRGVDIYKKTSPGGRLNAEQQIKGLTSLFQKLGVNNISGKTIEKIYKKCNLTTFFNIINATPMSISRCFPMEGKTNKNIIEEFTKLKQRPIQLHILVSAAGVLGQGIGELKTYQLLNTLGYEKIPTISDILSLSGFAQKTAEQIVQHFPQMQQFIQKCKDNKLNIVINIQKQNRIVICLSGFRDKKLEQQFDVKNNISHDVQYLVVLSKNNVTGKIKEAQKYNIPVVTREEFFSMFPQN